MKRRKLLVGAAATAVGAATLPWWLRGSDNPRESNAAPSGSATKSPRSHRSASRPNVLMISIDDLKPWIGPHGYADAHTPALDEFSRRGMVFRKAYCAAPACSPSRGSVFTGLAPHQTGCYLNRHNWRDFAGKVITFPHLLREAGYFTAGFGKLFHVNSHDDPLAWDEREYLRLIKAPKGAPINVPRSIWHRSGSRFDWAPLDRPVEEMDDHRQVDRAIAAMKRTRDRPWFVACGIFRPHLPWYVPRRFFDLHPLDSIAMPEVIAGDLDDVPARGRRLAKQEEHRILVSHGLWREAVQAYKASISYADFEVGRLLAETPSDTAIVLWSDHGWHLGPKNHWHKYALWEEASQCVFAIAGPGVKAGQQCARTVSLNDIYPTICDLVGLAPPHLLAGRSVLPLAANPKAAWNRPALTTYGPGNHAIRSEQYRYIRYDDGGEELYDHEVDPHEWHNLAARPESAAIIDAHAPLLPPLVAKKGKKVDKDKAQDKGKKRSKGKKRKSVWLDLPNGRRALVSS